MSHRHSGRGPVRFSSRHAAQQSLGGNCPVLSRMHKVLIRVTLALLLIGCGSESVPVELVVRELGPFEEGMTELPLALWGTGAATLELEVEGPGSLRASLVGESSAAEAVIETELSSGSNFMEVALPGAGVRFFRLEVEADSTVRWLRARVTEEKASPANTAEVNRPSLDRRDVLVLVADSLAAPHLGCYGYERDTSPALDRLASEGTRFASASSQTSWTLPSVVTLFTSQEQERHGVLRMDNRLDDRLTTLAELFSQKGYRTVGLIQSGVIQASTGVSRGFDTYREYGWDDGGNLKLVQDAREEFAKPDRAPLFVYVHLLPPHGPYVPPNELTRSFVDPDYDGPIDGGIRSMQALIKRRPGEDDPDVEHLEALYDGYVRYADGVLGELAEPFFGLPEEERPLVIVTSDHGEAFFEHGAQGHNRNIHQEMVHIPLVFWMPGTGLPAGQVVSSPVSLLDLLPTLQDLCELGETRQIRQGASLLGLLDGATPEEKLAPRPIFLTSRHYDGGRSFQRGVRLGSYKLIRRSRKNGSVDELLFDLDTDPGEFENLAEEFPIRHAAMKWLLERWWREVTEVGLDQERADLDAERREAIEAIGYTGEDG